MKKLSITILAVCFALGMPLAAMAMNHMEHSDMDKSMSGEKMQHGDMEHADQGQHMGQNMDMDMDHDKGMGHKMSGMDGDDFVEIGKDTQDGVVATVKVKTYDDETRATMAKMGMHATHHVMVFFTDEKSGEAVGGGKAALKVKGEEGKPSMMMQMGEGYGVDVNLEEMMNTFEIGTKLEDGEKRQFSIMFHNM